MKYLLALFLFLIPSFALAQKPVDQVVLNKQIAEAVARDRATLNQMRRPVGYAPVIVVLPQGINMGVSAVVSADRRYVRISTCPMFSAVTAVHTFTYQR